MKTYYLDFDGTLSRFYEESFCLEKMKEPGFFENLKPYDNMVKAIKIMSSIAEKIKGIQVICLSAVQDPDASTEFREKMNWLRRNDCLVECIFVRSGTSKAEAIENLLRHSLTEDDILVDDYSSNLIDWVLHGGTAVKFYNEINGRGWNKLNFCGPSISYDEDPEEIAANLINVK